MKILPVVMCGGAGNAGVARIAREPAQAVHPTGRQALDVPGHDRDARQRAVRDAGRDFEHRIPLPRRRTAAADRPRRAHRARADAPRFRAGRGGRGGAGGPGVARHGRRGPCRRSRRARPRRLRRSLPAGGRGGGRRLYRDARHSADGADERLRLHPHRGDDRRQGGGDEGRRLRRKARPRHGRTLHGGTLPLELRQFLLPGRHHAGRAEALRAGHAGRRGGGRRAGETGPQFPRPRRHGLRTPRPRSRSTMP